MLTYTDVGQFDDLLTDCLIERLWYGCRVRKVRGYKPIRGVTGDAVVAILREELHCERPAVSQAVARFVALPQVAAFVRRLGCRQKEAEFERHVRRYVLTYARECGFGVEVSDRYKARSGSDEACVVARRPFGEGDEIRYLTGVLVALSDEDLDQLRADGENRDFSILNSSRLGTNCLMLGPARFVNHDCSANAKFVSCRGTMTVYAKRPIAVGEEITVEYAKNYFGRGNRECLCATCEALGRNGFAEGAFAGNDSSDEDQDSDDSSGDETRTPSSRPSTPPSEGDSDRLSPVTEADTPRGTPGGTPAETPTATPEPGAKTRLLRKRPAREPVPARKTGDYVAFYSLYHKTVFDPSVRAACWTCRNCKVPYQPATTDLRNQQITLCPRCYRHAKVYNAYWPSTAPQEDEIDPHLFVADSDSESDLEPQPADHGPSTTTKSRTGRKPSAWLLKRLNEDAAKPASRAGRPRKRGQSVSSSPARPPPSKMRRKSAPPAPPSRRSKRVLDKQLNLPPRRRTPSRRLLESQL